MTQLTWDEVGTHIFQTGVDHGVLYPEGGPGVPWNGLVGVSENISGGEVSSFYFDGVKYIDIVANTDFQANLEAFTYPDEFELCDGSAVMAPGLSVMDQPRKRFGLCYRTKIGNDIDQEIGFKLHLVYNAVATPSARANKTLSKQADPLLFNWIINSTPPDNDLYLGFKPTAHFVIDSRTVSPPAMVILEEALYGTDTTDPYLPDQDYVVGLLNTTLLDVLDGGVPSYSSPDIADGNIGPTIVDGGTP